MFDAFGMTKKRSGSTHQTMMSSTTCASSASSRCVYCARPGSMRPRSFVSSALQRRVRVRAGAFDGAEVRDVEHGRVLAARAVLLEHAAVLDRHLPTAERRQLGAERAVPSVERAGAHARLRALGRRDRAVSAAGRRSPSSRSARTVFAARRRRRAATAVRARTSRAGAGSRAGTARGSRPRGAARAAGAPCGSSSSRASG